MSAKATVVVRFDHLPEIAAKLPRVLEALVSKACADTEGLAKGSAPVDTGNLKNSIAHEVTSGGGKTEGVVYTDVVYGPYQEFGTRFVPPHPYMTPAFERVAPELQRALSSLDDELK